MRIIVTGASGFVGSRLIAELARAGHTGYAVSRREVAGLPPGWSWLPRRELLEGGNSFFKDRGAHQWLIHLEVKQHVEAPTEGDRREFQSVNVDGTREWLEWCDRNAVEQFALFSTIKAVGDDNGVRDETADSSPTSPYGASKREAEELLSVWARTKAGRCAVILRPAVIYGPGNQANVFSMVRAIDRGFFLLVGKNENVKSLVSIMNVAAAVVHLVGRASAGTETYYIVDRESYSVREIANLVACELERPRRMWTLPLSLARLVAEAGELLRKTTGRKAPLTRSRLKALVETTHFSCGKLLQTGFIHPQSTRDGLSEMVAWYRRINTR